MADERLPGWEADRMQCTALVREQDSRGRCARDMLLSDLRALLKAMTQEQREAVTRENYNAQLRNADLSPIAELQKMLAATEANRDEWKARAESAEGRTTPGPDHGTVALCWCGKPSQNPARHDWCGECKIPSDPEIAAAWQNRRELRADRDAWKRRHGETCEALALAKQRVESAEARHAVQQRSDAKVIMELQAKRDAFLRDCDAASKDRDEWKRKAEAPREERKAALSEVAAVRAGAGDWAWSNSAAIDAVAGSAQHLRKTLMTRADLADLLEAGAAALRDPKKGDNLVTDNENDLYGDDPDDLGPPWIVFSDQGRPVAILPAGRMGAVADVTALDPDVAERIVACANAAERGAYQRLAALAARVEALQERTQAAETSIDVLKAQQEAVTNARAVVDAWKDALVEHPEVGLHVAFNDAMLALIASLGTLSQQADSP